MELLKSTELRLASASSEKPVDISINEVLITLAQQTGLPLGLIDSDRELDIDGLNKTLKPLKNFGNLL